MEEKPERVEGFTECPGCNSLDNVALVRENVGILWCSCGKVYKIAYCPKHKIYWWHRLVPLTEF